MPCDLNMTQMQTSMARSLSRLFSDLNQWLFRLDPIVVQSFSFFRNLSNSLSHKGLYCFFLHPLLSIPLFSSLYKPVGFQFFFMYFSIEFFLLIPSLILILCPLWEELNYRKREETRNESMLFR
jgi:hypothetical protein